MSFPFGRTAWRLRAGLVEDEYSGLMVPGDWDHPTVLALPGSFIAHTSTALLATATRDQASESKSLFCDGAFDVRKGDRVFDGTFTPPLPAAAYDGGSAASTGAGTLSGGSAGLTGELVMGGVASTVTFDSVSSIPAGTVFFGAIYTIDGIPPAADTNPWTGWTPPREIPLTRYVG